MSMNHLLEIPRLKKKKYDEIMIIKDKDLYSQGDLL
jgi:hypothetical protein